MEILSARDYVEQATINNLTQSMAQDWGKDHIRVNAICPGLIKTQFSEALWTIRKRWNDS